jgi:serine protease
MSAVAIFVCTTLAATLTVPTPYATIQGAIDSAIDGDTILVSPGLYSENLHFRGKALFVTSTFLTDQDPATIRATIIDGSNPVNGDSGSVVVFVATAASSPTLYGFTLRNGIGTAVPGSYRGGGIFISDSCAPVVKYNIIRGNNALVGGGIAARNAKPVISHNAIFANNADKGGGVSLTGCQVLLEHNVVYGNAATSQGGGLYAQSSTVDFGHNIIAYDTAASGGGIYCSDGELGIEFCDLYGNLGGDLVGCMPAGFGDTSWGYNFNHDRVDAYYNLFVDPMLSNPAALNFALNCNSRLVDAGENMPETFPYGGKREDIGMFEIKYYPGDMNYDKKLNLADATAIVNIIFRNASLPCPIYVADLDCNRKINMSDLVGLIAYWSGLGPVPCALSPAIR